MKRPDSPVDFPQREAAKTPAAALKLATRPESLEQMAAKCKREEARISGKVVKLRRRR